jgi:hypothetical protein
VLVTKWGISKIYFTELPKEIQDRFAYDAAESRSSTAKQDTRPELIPTNQAAQQPTEAATQPLPQANPSRSDETALDRTYEITRDYVIGGDTGKVAMRLRRGDHYRGRIFPDRAELHIDGISYTVPSDILSASKD